MRTDHETEIIWKQKYETLKSMVDEMISSVDLQELERSEFPAFYASEFLYVSFNLDTVGDENKAKHFFGEGNYDIYRLWKESPKHAEADKVDEKDKPGIV